MKRKKKRRIRDKIKWKENIQRYKMREETEWNESEIWIDNDAGMWGYMDVKNNMYGEKR